MADRWDVSEPLEPPEEGSSGDRSGTPGALLESLRQKGALGILEQAPEQAVLIEFPLGAWWRARTGCSRFVRLRDSSNGTAYALIRQAGES